MEGMHNIVGLHSLWLPILLSAVFVFIVSSIIHMAFQWWHKDEYPRLPDEDKVMDALRPFNIPPGDYMMPRAYGTAEMKSPEFNEKWKKGPVMVLTVLPPGPFSMTKSLVLWFFYAVVVSVFAGYVAGRALPAGSEYLEVFRFAGTTAFVGYAVGLWQMSIWYNRSWKTTIKATVDGLIYALVTAGAFGWLWPAKWLMGG
ncbi:MAG: hypothetical protein ACRDGA_06160 [Bacteroidota bacterium]